MPSMPHMSGGVREAVGRSVGWLSIGRVLVLQLLQTIVGEVYTYGRGARLDQHALHVAAHAQLLVRLAKVGRPCALLVVEVRLRQELGRNESGTTQTTHERRVASRIPRQTASTRARQPPEKKQSKPIIQSFIHPCCMNLTHDAWRRGASRCVCVCVCVCVCAAVGVPQTIKKQRACAFWTTNRSYSLEQFVDHLGIVGVEVAELARSRGAAGLMRHGGGIVVRTELP